jgi:hypothetical protein
MNNSVIDRVTSWFRSASVGRRNAVIGGLTLLGLGVLLYATSGRPEPVAVTTPQAETTPAVATVAETPAVEEKPAAPTPEALWAAAVARLEQADRESARALETRRAELAGFFGERKKGALAFAAAMTSPEAKLRFTGDCALGLPLGLANALFGDGKRVEPGVERYARDRFAQHVLTPEQLRLAADQLVAHYGNDIDEINARFLVDVRIDSALPRVRSDYRAPTFDTASPGFDGLIDRVVGQTFRDTLASAASMFVGDAITGGVLPSSTNPVVRLGADVIVGDKVGNAVEGAMAQTGFDPKARVVELVVAALDDLLTKMVGRGGFEAALREMHDRASRERRELARRVAGTTSTE